MRDGDAFLACRPTDLARVAERLGAADATAEGIAAALSDLPLQHAAGLLQSVVGASLVAISSLDALRAASILAEGEAFDGKRMSTAMVRAPHPSGHRVTLPLPTWYRSPSFEIQPLSAAPAPGHDSRSILAEQGSTESDWHYLLEHGVVGDRWAVLQHYLPR